MVSEQLESRGIHDPRVLQAMRTVPRHVFVAPDLWPQAYRDSPLPIGEEQTISQPYIVGFMLQMLAIEPQQRVLEIGSGTGYQAALLGMLAAEVFTVERNAVLAAAAERNMRELGLANVKVITADGSRGLPEHAPYDRIIAAATAPDVPLPLFEQLVESGRMLIPLGDAFEQWLYLVRKTNGQPSLNKVAAVRFVPMVGEAANPPKH
ncbi:MAG TPA: protein-L-isoaspartate(D-aspartate) O-methyltransferase [candidate division Zixibacteria bacterium]|nr:protein-L-isoaspartate(D-aspartate) O-methyltransferase [candidate division Zixibacteria bacterium]